MSGDQPSSQLTTEQWEQKLAQLRTTNEELQRRRLEAEKDRDLFRDLYGKASAHASSVSAENNELTERAALAEGQAREGLAMLKATYEERIRLLEQETLRWKGQCQVLTDRDGRMDDEIRRRAALEPELRAENERLRDQIDSLEEDYASMEGLLEGMTRQQVEETSELESTAKHHVLAPLSVEVS
ncbi:hypothetical protein K466DRAFT_582154 [Polyporus arcularius HHB13444]|uniref:Uncharacterized protein n=1 Tax=Polyporus arcularius HHB13444 TaxID=1314778 RepID=A0A5C3Q118_9APHY|nr:hypothetical protein K466DRAFT_582154 [Polyporus arcularius HHB13444]